MSKIKSSFDLAAGERRVLTIKSPTLGRGESGDAQFSAPIDIIKSSELTRRRGELTRRHSGNGGYTSHSGEN